jgi:hypothetical protein
MKSGIAHDRSFSRSFQSAPAAVKLYTEPEEDIRVLGELVRDVGVMKDMLAGLAFSSMEEYRKNLRVVRNAAERTIRRCDRLIGDEPNPNAS